MLSLRRFKAFFERGMQGNRLSFYFLLGLIGKEKLEGLYRVSHRLLYCTGDPTALLLTLWAGLAAGHFRNEALEGAVPCTLLLLKVACTEGLMGRCNLTYRWISVNAFVVTVTADSVLFLLIPRRAYTASLGETAVAFDFGPLVPVPVSILGQRGSEEVLAFPLYILYENGETFLTYINLLQR